MSSQWPKFGNVKIHLKFQPEKLVDVSHIRTRATSNTHSLSCANENVYEINHGSYWMIVWFDFFFPRIESFSPTVRQSIAIESQRKEIEGIGSHRSVLFTWATPVWSEVARSGGCWMVDGAATRATRRWRKWSPFFTRSLSLYVWV